MAQRDALAERERCAPRLRFVAAGATIERLRAVRTRIAGWSAVDGGPGRLYLGRANLVKIVSVICKRGPPSDRMGS
jgi:hypothetical protein